LAAVSLSGISGMFLGSSPLVEYMNKAVPNNGNPFIAPGVLLPAVYVFVALAVLLPVFGHLLRAGSLSIGTLGAMTSLSLAYPLLIGIGSDLSCIWLQFAGATIGALGYASVMQILQVVAIQWWAAIDKTHIGVAITGAAVGIAAVAGTLENAMLCEAFGLARTMYIHTGQVALFVAYPLWLVRHDQLQLPPSALMKRGCETSGETHDRVSEKSPDRLKAVACSSPIELLSTIDFWQLMLHFSVSAFAGLGMKALLSPIFMVAYDMAYLRSAYFSASSLVLFVVVRVSMPFLASRLRASSTSSVMLALDVMLFASAPYVIARSPPEWLLFLKTITGGCFAGMAILYSQLIVEVFGAVNLALVWSLLAPAVGIGQALGPIVGYYIFVSDAGNARQHAYDSFFYICASLAALALVNLGLLMIRMA